MFVSQKNSLSESEGKLIIFFSSSVTRTPYEAGFSFLFVFYLIQQRDVKNSAEDQNVCMCVRLFVS